MENTVKVNKDYSKHSEQETGEVPEKCQTRRLGNGALANEPQGASE
jgi:hypothetical protein